MKNYKANKTYMSKKNFYVAVIFIVLSTILIIAVSFKRSLKPKVNEPIIKIEDSEVIPTTQTKNDVKKESSDLEKSPAVKESTKSASQTKPENKSAESKSDKTQKPPVKKVSKYVKPVEGTILAEFSGDRLVKSKTLGEFRTHNGVDIEALPATPVKSISDGKVVSLWNDEGRWGNCMAIEHAGGLTSIYAGLNENVNVKIDSKVSAGDVIGSVGKTNMFEGGLPSHLHLELKKNGVFVNPLDYVKY